MNVNEIQNVNDVSTVEVFDSEGKQLWSGDEVHDGDVTAVVFSSETTDGKTLHSMSFTKH